MISENMCGWMCDCCGRVVLCLRLIMVVNVLMRVSSSSLGRFWSSLVVVCAMVWAICLSRSSCAVGGDG